MHAKQARRSARAAAMRSASSLKIISTSSSDPRRSTIAIAVSAPLSEDNQGRHREPLRSGLRFLATIFRGHRASFGRSNAADANQRLRRRLFPAEGVMRSKDKEYRQRNHRPSCEHTDPVEHRNIMARICA